MFLVNPAAYSSREYIPRLNQRIIHSHLAVMGKWKAAARENSRIIHVYEYIEYSSLVESS
jgi:hypothetical protein